MFFLGNGLILQIFNKIFRENFKQNKNIINEKTKNQILNFNIQQRINI